MGSWAWLWRARDWVQRKRKPRKPVRAGKEPYVGRIAGHSAGLRRDVAYVVVISALL
jgi:hypothetical protein